MEFSAYVPAIAGGLMIGAAVALYLLGAGQIAGVSGIFASALERRANSAGLAFLAGLVAAPWLAVAAGVALPFRELDTAHWGKLALAGALVGAGTWIGTGCTSGHGLCGIADRRPRGFAATATFMAVAALVVNLGFGGIQ